MKTLEQQVVDFLNQKRIREEEQETKMREVLEQFEEMDTSDEEKRFSDQLVIYSARLYDEEETREILFYDEEGRPVYEGDDEKILQMANNEARVWYKAVDQTEVRNPSQSRVDMMDALYDLAVLEVSGKGYTEGEYLSARTNAIRAIEFINYGRMKAELPRLSNDKIAEWYDQQKELAFKDMEEYTCVTYVGAVGIEHASWMGDDGEYIFDEGEYTGEESTGHFSGSDQEWTDKVISYIFNCMDPEGLGYATKPMKKQGKCYTPKTKRMRSLNHRSVTESLYWLHGPKGKQGFVSDSRLTRDGREALWQFINASWEVVKKGKEVEQNK